MVGFHDDLGPVVGEKTAKGLRTAFGMSTVADLLMHLPRRYIHRAESNDFGTLEAGQFITVKGEIRTVTSRRFKQRRGTITDVVVADAKGATLSLTFFNQQWREGQLKPGRTGLFAGRVSEFNGKKQLAHPEMLLAPHGGEVDADSAAMFEREIIPVYPGSAKVSSLTLSRCIAYVLGVVDLPDDPIPEIILERQGLMSFGEAIFEIHRPSSEARCGAARRRLVFEEAFLLLGIMRRRRQRAAEQPATARVPVGSLRSRFDARLPFALTEGQQEIGHQIDHDLAQAHPMHRLLQGEVGSGKTVVALRAMLAVVDAGGQCAILAPTEVLAQQHYRSIRALLGDLAAAGELEGADNATQVVLLTGSTGAAARRAAYGAMTSGSAGIVIGTHALLEERVRFHDLGLIVVDEQHRFGVEQRAALMAKARDGVVPHLLVMTATPIPRTAAITIFGDLDVSTLRELPAGRTPLISHAVPVLEKPHYERRVWERVREEVERGHQAYVVCPRISTKDATDDESSPAAAEEVVERLRTQDLAGLRVGLLHGRMASDEKDAVMRRFANLGPDGIDVLVSTTVIEVGVDVPNATIMVILDADRFGISQLHQLRGRVGRGAAAGSCFLLSRLPADSAAGTRLAEVAGSTDGFHLAQVDLEQRGEGDVLGTLQSGGRSSLRLLSVLRDQTVIASAHDEVDGIFAVDPALLTHPTLQRALDLREWELDAEYLEKA